VAAEADGTESPKGKLAMKAMKADKSAMLDALVEKIEKDDEEGFVSESVSEEEGTPKSKKDRDPVFENPERECCVYVILKIH